jgi:monoamine oxidase
MTFPGYMDGAVEAGERAAREVLHAMKKITQEEIYQQEPFSEDVPPVPCGLTSMQLCLPSVPTFLTAMATLSIATIVGIGYLKLSKK